MRKLFSLLVTFACAVTAFGQSAEEIVNRMDAEMDKHQDDGLYMIVEIKISILGSLATKTWVVGEKMKMEATVMGATVVTWMDEKTEWTYNSKDNELEIANRKEDTKSTSEGDAKLFDNVTDGYDVSIKKETDDAWYILCKKSRNNKDKDDPKTMDLVIAKGTYLPVSLSAKLSGVTMTMRNLRFGVSESEVTFDPSAFSDAKVIDKR